MSFVFKKLNTKHVTQRDMILFGQPYDKEKYLGGVRRFTDFSYDDYEALLNLGVIDPDDCQNQAPSVFAIAGFLRDHPNFCAHGYAVSPDRDDYRVSLEGVECNGEYSLEDVWDMCSVFLYPDELIISPGLIRCWFD